MRRFFSYFLEDERFKRTDKMKEEIAEGKLPDLASERLMMRS